MNYTIENIKSRRSVRSYTDQKIPKKILEEILEAARFAPSALNKQPWKFIVITNKPLLDEISASITNSIKKIYALSPLLKLIVPRLRDEKTFAALKKTATNADDTVFYNAPALIFIVSNKKGSWVHTNCSLAAENMMLAAHSLGLGSCFIGRCDMLPKDKKLCKKIGLRSGYKIHASLVFGYPKEFPKTIPQRRKDNLICWKE